MFGRERKKERTGPRRGIGPRVIVVFALVLTAMMWQVGCDEPTKYRILSFFFDGVPVPPELAGTVPEQPEMVMGPWGIPLDPNDPRTTDILRKRRARASAELAQDELLYVHSPYRKRQCICHDGQESFGVPVTTESCRTCHQDHFDLAEGDWVHGPVAMGKCSLCHVSHASKYKHLLVQPVPEICFQCHQPAQVLAKAYHQDAVETGCSTCHDPHAAGNRALLADSNTYLRRQGHAKPRITPHSKWNDDKKNSCPTCHLSTKSNLVRKEVDDVCMACHKESRAEPAGAKWLHAPVRAGKCTTCHTAHNTPLDKLVRIDAEKLCLDCHALDEIPGQAHANMRRVDCLICHAGHISPQKHLLKGAGFTVHSDRAANEDGHSSEGSGP